MSPLKNIADTSPARTTITVKNDKSGYASELTQILLSNQISPKSTVGKRLMAAFKSDAQTVAFDFPPIEGFFLTINREMGEIVLTALSGSRLIRFEFFSSADPDSPQPTMSSTTVIPLSRVRRVVENITGPVPSGAPSSTILTIEFEADQTTTFLDSVPVVVGQDDAGNPVTNNVNVERTRHPAFILEASGSQPEGKPSSISLEQARLRAFASALRWAMAG